VFKNVLAYIALQLPCLLAITSHLAPTWLFLRCRKPSYVYSVRWYCIFTSFT